MIPIIEEHREELIRIAKDTELKGLWVFGSAANGTWNPETSDIDFLFDIGSYEPETRPGRRWMRLISSLERLFGEDIDIVSRPAIKRESFRREVDRTAVAIYER